MGRLEELNNISRRICGEAHYGFAIEYSYPCGFRVAATALAVGAFCVYFGGTFADAAFAAIIGNVLGFIKFRKTDFNIFSKTLIQSTAAAFLAFAPKIAGLSVHPDMIMTGTIMLLIPGMSIGGAMQDMMSGNLIAGILQITQAVVIAFAIVLGFAAALAVFG
ncbi:MAG: threonine/serine exporter family protein [Anaerotruncus sp.]|nr:MAG: threonine/serine exporter family protein [Anaerotruncus sp.]